MAVTDLMSSLGSSTDSPERLQEKANRALTGKHKQELGLDLNQPVDFEEVYAVPELEKVTVEELKILYPVKVAGKVLEQAAEILNTATEDMDYVMAKEFRDNCLSFIDILKNSKSRVSFADYVNACKFATFKLAGNTDVRAYALTFPDRIRRMERDKVPNSHLYQYASIYSKNKTVVEVMAKLVVPTHIMFQDIFHQAVKVQSELMLDDSISPKVRSDAANSLMTHLKTPEVKQAELKVDVQGSGAIEQLAEALGSLSGKQSEMLREGRYSLKDIREATIIEVTEDD
jgi:N4 gp69-like protein